MDADKSKELLQELNFLKNIESTLFMDNKPAINLIQNNKPPQTMKHLSIKFHSVRDKVKNGEYKIKYCPTNDMLADIFTKSLDKIKFVNLRT
jgi:KUP system potassium uptake protein